MYIVSIDRMYAIVNEGVLRGWNEKANLNTRQNNQDALQCPGVQLQPSLPRPAACPKSRSVKPESSPIAWLE